MRFEFFSERLLPFLLNVALEAIWQSIDNFVPEREIVYGAPKLRD